MSNHRESEKDTQPVSSDDASGAERTLHIAIIGAGVSGLAAAIALLRNPKCDGRLRSITLFDKQQRIGGVLGHSTQDGYLVEAAAQGVLASRDSFTSLLSASGLAGEALTGPEGLRRFLIVDGDQPLAAVSPNPLALVRSGLLSLRGLLRVLWEPFVARGQATSKETLFAFVERRFGHAVAMRFIVPLATGIWGGGAGRILVRHVFPRLVQLEQNSGSVIRGLAALMIKKLFQRQRRPKQSPLKGLVTFKAGMERFPLALHKLAMDLAEQSGIELCMRLSSEIAAVEIATEAASPVSKSATRFRLHLSPARSGAVSAADVPLEFDGVISTVPLWREDLHFRLATSFQDPQTAAFLDERLARLRHTSSHGLVVVGLGGKDSIPPAQGFGALAPAASKDLLGVIFVHSVVPDHAPSGHFLYRLMLGGDRDPGFVERSNQDCLSCAKQHLLKLGFVTKEATFEFERVFKWPAVIPLQDESQDDRLVAISELEHTFPGLIFAGNYLTGVGIHDCLVAADAAAGRMVKHLGGPTHLRNDPAHNGE